MKTYKTGQIAKICDVAPRTVSKWIDRGLLNGYHLPSSNDRRVTEENLVKFLEAANMPVPEYMKQAADVVTSVGGAIAAPMSSTQVRLLGKHGSPAAFAQACYKAVPDDISMEEARVAVEKYQREWDEAGGK